MSKNTLSCNGVLERGDYLISNNGNFKAIFQEDGNFVVYGWKPIWATNTGGLAGDRVIMQSDCNLVMYDGASVSPNSLWASATSYRSGPPHLRAHARIENDGTLVVRDSDEVLWKSTQ
ncbi:B-type lectin plumieribetin-like [Engraulis encrasicolus]|uniref:B-type lectin plumieribetin-like n=1 Tax=Engraulis encrasicolus TaxID=184585 RepID=UPI002FD74D01